MTLAAGAAAPAGAIAVEFAAAAPSTGLPDGELGSLALRRLTFGTR
jgi:hypothetical protein